MKYLLFLMVLLLPQMTKAEPLGSLKGRWAFDFMNPEHTKCEEITAAWLKKVKNAAKVVCRKQPPAQAFNQAGGLWFECKGGKFTRHVFTSKKLCVDNLETEQANGP